MGLQPDDPWRDAMLEQCVLAAPIVVRAQIAYISGDVNESERLLRRAVLVAPSDADAKLALANMLMLSKRATTESVQEAFTLLDQANDDSARDPIYSLAASVGPVATWTEGRSWTRMGSHRCIAS